jgi:purine-binding chemotaxis protein CheW
MDHARRSDSPDVVDGSPYLICRSNSCLCALPLESVAETMRPLPVEPLAPAPAFVLGVTVIRGAATPVVDIALLLGSLASVPPQRFVTLKIGVRHVALAVEGVIGVHALPAAGLDEVPALLSGAANETVSAISTLDAQLLLVLQSARLVPESVWATIDSQATPP